MYKKKRKETLRHLPLPLHHPHLPRDRLHLLNPNPDEGLRDLDLDKKDIKEEMSRGKEDQGEIEGIMIAPQDNIEGGEDDGDIIHIINK